MLKKLIFLGAFLVCAEIFADFPYLLIGGIADGGHVKYPEVVYVNNNFSACSATIVGERVVLIASHCAADQTYIESYRASVQKFSAKCFHAPTDKAADLDVALCLADTRLKGPYASIADHGPDLGEMVALMGYGCTRSDRSGGNDGILRYGLAKVSGLDMGNSVYFQTTHSVALCSGDSGGPSMLNEDHHQIIGVNSRGDLHTRSLMVALYSSYAQDYFRQFAEKHHVEICGINKECP